MLRKTTCYISYKHYIIALHKAALNLNVHCTTRMHVLCDLVTGFLLAHLSTKCSVSFCDPSMSGVRRPSSVRPCVRPSVRQQFLKTTSPLKPLIGFWPNFTGMIPGWSPIKVAQTVPVGSISRSRGQKIDFQNAIFKNLLVQNYKAQSFHIWYIASSRGPLPKLFKLCPWGQNWSPGVTILHWII